MGHYTHLTLEEREDVMCWRRQGLSIRAIAARLDRSASTISREIRRNYCGFYYRASTAERRYRERRRACARRPLLDDCERRALVVSHVLEGQWSPEQLSGRLALERPDLAVSASTIRRAIACGELDREIGGRKASARLRRKGRKPRTGRAQEARGKIKISHELSERPAQAQARSRIGDWEGDTVAGRAGGACLVTMVDRRSGYLVGDKSPSKRKGDVRLAMSRALTGHRLETLTLDRGKEFAEHALLTRELDVECYFCLPRHPWQRGTNENTNGLLREYFPKGKPLDAVTDQEIQAVFDRLNHRPRKRLGWKCPEEVYRSQTLHLL